MDSFGLKIKESSIFDVYIGFFGFVFAIDGGLSCDDLEASTLVVRSEAVDSLVYFLVVMLLVGMDRNIDDVVVRRCLMFR